MSHVPFSGTDPRAAQDEKRQALQRLLVIHYKRCFTSDSGKKVLADLKKRFGFNQWPAEDTEDERKIARRVFAQGPLYHIQKQLDNPLKPKRTSAKEVNSPPE